VSDSAGAYFSQRTAGLAHCCLRGLRAGSVRLNLCESSPAEAGYLGRIRVRSFPSTEDTAMAIVWWIIVGLIAGYLTGKLMKGSGYGALMDIVVGIIGAIIGGFIMRSLGFRGSGGVIYTILIAILGAVILTWIVRLVTGGRRAQL